MPSLRLLSRSLSILSSRRRPNLVHIPGLAKQALVEMGVGFNKAGQQQRAVAVLDCHASRRR